MSTETLCEILPLQATPINTPDLKVEELLDDQKLDNQVTINPYFKDLVHQIEETQNYFENLVEDLILKKDSEFYSNWIKDDPSKQIKENNTVLNQSNTILNNENKEASELNKTKVSPIREKDKENAENVDPLDENNVLGTQHEKEENKEKSLLLAKIQNNLRTITRGSDERKVTPICSNAQKISTILQTSKLNESIIALNKQSIVLQQTRRKPSQITHIKEAISVSKSNIQYGNVLPGYILENEIEIQNKINHNLNVKLTILCHNPELDDHDEYVYSIRKMTIYEYNDKLLVTLPPNSTQRFKIALKVPNLKQRTFLKGSVNIYIQGVDSNISLPISSIVELPEIICPKELYDESNDVKVIKFALKKGRKQDCKIPFKNNYLSNLELEFEVIEPKTPEYKKNKIFDILIYPNVYTVGANGMGILNLIMKPIMRNIGADEQIKFINAVVLITIKNSSVIYHFPLSLEIY